MNRLGTRVSRERDTRWGRHHKLPTGIKSERSVNRGIKRDQGLLDQCLHLGGV